MKTLRLALALVLTVAALPSLAVAAAPEFISQPFSLSVASGDPAVLACDAAGSPTPTLQWRRNDLPIAGATARRLVVSSAGPEHTGNYTCTATSSVGTTTSTVAVLTVLDSANPGRLVNLSIRTNAGTGAETLITGFAVGGAGAAGSKPLLLRGVGPSLAQFGVSGVLRDPLLTVYSGADATAMNDDWAGNAQIRNVTANVGAFALAGDAAKDCAIFAPATAIGSHTAQISCRDGSSGMVLAEIYDATPQLSFTATTPRLINVSARARVGTSSDLLIAGFVIGGSTAKTLLIRAVGPTLSSFGVTGVLLDPELEVYAGARRLSSNDDWGNDADVAHAATLVGGFPLVRAGKDSALLATLPPGSYTAQVRGVGTATGVGLVELYEVPASPSWPTVAAPAGFLTVLYDNYPFHEGCVTGWGFSALIEGVGRTILFDAGPDAAALDRNAEALNVDLARSDFVFISHEHIDHTAGLAAVFGKKPAVPAYVPFSAAPQFQSAVRGSGAQLVAVKEPQEIAPGIYSTGDLGQAIHEHALILDTPEGSVVLTGCAHPGIVSLVQRSREVGKKNVRMVLGGFHLSGTSAAAVEQVIVRFKELGVTHVGATHCTGDAAIAMFREAFGQNFVELGVGRKVDLGAH